MLVSRVIPLYSKFVRVGETADLFHSFAVSGNELVCAFRRHKISNTETSSEWVHSYQSQILLQNFDLSAGTFVSEPEEIMDVGEDPRCIAIRGRPYILSSNPPGLSCNYILFDITARKRINIMTDADRFRYGKNWQPFVFDDKLYAIHGFSPFRILRIDIETGRGDIVFEKDMGLNAVASHDRYTCFRGGCTALVLNDEIVGFGHLTVDPGRHAVFQWTFSPVRQQISISCDLDVKILTAQAFNVIDPTCFFSLHDKYYLGVSCSNRDWFYGQTYASFLLELKPDPYRPKSLAFLLKNGNSGIQPDSGSASRSTYFARASELRITNGSISRNFEVLSRAGREDRGHVVCGPCINLPPGKYLSRVQYAGNGSNSQEIGSYIVYRNADQEMLAE